MEGTYAQSTEWKPDVPTSLYTATANRNHTELARLLNMPAFIDMVNQPGSNEYTPLHIAIRNDDITSVKLLLKYGADPKAWFPRCEGHFIMESTSLTEAADLGFLEILGFLIQKGVPVPSVALYYATESGQLECVKEIFTWLISRNRAKFDDGVDKTTAVAFALQLAASGWRNDIVEFLLDSKDADKTAIDCAFLRVMIPDFEHDDYPIRNCVRKRPAEEARKARIEVVRLLLEAGADVNASDRPSVRAMRPLHEMAREGIRGREIFDMLLEKDVDVESLNNKGTGHEDGRTPLFQAVIADDVYFTRRLLEKGADITHIDQFGNTLLHASISNETPACGAIISLLLDHGLLCSARNSIGRTALHEAASHGNIEAVKLLLSANHDLINCKTAEGWSAFHFVADSYFDQQRIDISKALLEHGADINAVTAEGWTVLQRAVAGNIRDTTQFISFLLENGADVTVTDRTGMLGNSWPDQLSSVPVSAEIRVARIVEPARDSLLHLALDIRNTNTTRALCLLLDNGADIEWRDAQGRTPLLRAVGKWDSTEDFGRRLREDYLMELITRGANICARDNAGRGLEDLVMKKGYTVRMINGRVIEFERIPGPLTNAQLAGLDKMGRGRGRGKTREIAAAVRGLANVY